MSGVWKMVESGVLTKASSKYWLLLFAALSGATTAIYCLVSGANAEVALVVGVAIGVGMILIRRPFQAYLLTIVLGLLADYAHWNFTAWTHSLGPYVFDSWRKLISPDDSDGIFRWLIFNSIEILLIAAMAGCVIDRHRYFPRVSSPIFPLTLAYAAVLVTFVVYGIHAGGDVEMALWQIRPFIHFVLIVLLGILLISSREQVMKLIWVSGIVVLFKALQVIWLFFTDAGSSFGEWREILGHEDSVFFAGFIGLAGAYALYELGHKSLRGWKGGALLIVSSLLIFALALNLRRAGYVALAFIFALMPFVLYGRRKLAAQLTLGFAIVVVGYMAIYWDASGTLGMPAEKIKSILFAEINSSDRLSNTYRLAENINLRNTITDHVFGIGFGHPFELRVALPDVTFLVPNWRYYPHNMILGTWMNLGAIGFAFFIFYHASIMASAAYYVRHTVDRQLRTVGFFALSTYASSFLVASVDQYIWSERGAIFLAMLVVIISAISHFSRTGAGGDAPTNA